MNCRSDCKWFDRANRWAGVDVDGAWVGHKSACKFHGAPYIDVIPDQSPCVGEYEQAQEAD